MSFRVTHKNDTFFVQRDVDNRVFSRYTNKDEAIEHAKTLNTEEKAWRQDKTIKIYERKEA